MKIPPKKFKFIHLNGAHVPYIYDKDMNIINELDGTYEQSAQATMVGAMDYVEHLRNSEAYDNTVLIVMSDHAITEAWDKAERLPGCVSVHYF